MSILEKQQSQARNPQKIAVISKNQYCLAFPHKSPSSHLLPTKPLATSPNCKILTSPEHKENKNNAHLKLLAQPRSSLCGKQHKQSIEKKEKDKLTKEKDVRKQKLIVKKQQKQIKQGKEGQCFITKSGVKEKIGDQCSERKCIEKTRYKSPNINVNTYTINNNSNSNIHNNNQNQNQNNNNIKTKINEISSGNLNSHINANSDNKANLIENNINGEFNQYKLGWQSNMKEKNNQDSGYNDGDSNTATPTLTKIRCNSQPAKFMRTSCSPNCHRDRYKQFQKQYYHNPKEVEQTYIPTISTFTSAPNLHFIPTMPTPSSKKTINQLQTLIVSQKTKISELHAVIKDKNAQLQKKNEEILRLNIFVNDYREKFIKMEEKQYALTRTMEIMIQEGKQLASCSGIFSNQHIGSPQKKKVEMLTESITFASPKSKDQQQQQKASQIQNAKPSSVQQSYMQLQKNFINLQKSVSLLMNDIPHILSSQSSTELQNNNLIRSLQQAIKYKDIEIAMLKRMKYLQRQKFLQKDRELKVIKYELRDIKFKIGKKVENKKSYNQKSGWLDDTDFTLQYSIQ